MHKKSLLIIFLVVFIDLLGFGIVIPILPYYAKSFGASATTLGLLMMSYSLMQFLFSPFWGKLSDKLGRRPILLTSITGIGLSLLVLGFANSLIWLFIGRILAGFFGANIAVASAYIADITGPEDRAKGMGMIGASFGLGFLFGPAIGGILSQWGYGTAPLFAAMLSALNLCFAFFFLRETPLSEELRRSHRHHLQRDRVKKTLQNPRTGLPIFLFFGVTLGFAQMEATFAFFLLSRFNLDAKHAGWILALMALVMIFIQGGAIGRLVRKYGEGKLIMLGTGLMSFALLAASFSPVLKIFVAFLLVQALGFSITNPSLSSLVSRAASAEDQGATLGVYQSAGSLARILGPIFAGLLFDHLGPPMPFQTAALLFGGICVIAWMQQKKLKAVL